MQTVEERKAYQAEWRRKNRDRINAYRRAYRKANPDKAKQWYQNSKEYQKKWREENMEEYNKYFVDRRESDPMFKAIKNMRNRLWMVLQSNKWDKDNKTKDLLGCDLDFLKDYLASQFTEGMSWDNYGEWHIDHIEPLSKAKNVKEIESLCHYTNLQPLWALDNIKKSNK